MQGEPWICTECGARIPFPIHDETTFAAARDEVTVFQHRLLNLYSLRQNTDEFVCAIPTSFEKDIAAMIEAGLLKVSSDGRWYELTQLGLEVLQHWNRQHKLGSETARQMRDEFMGK
jgi:hypothetical protein